MSRTLQRLMGPACAAVCLCAAAFGQKLTVSPAAMTFSYTLGSAALPNAQIMQVQSSPSGLNFTVAISGSPFNAAWLLVSASSGKAAASLKVEVNPTGLAAGSYAGTITVTAMSGATMLTQNVAVTLKVSSAPSTLTATPTSLNFSYVTGSPVPSASLSSAFVLSSSGGPLSATVSVKGASWLTVTPTGNISLIGLLNTVSVTVDPTGLAPKVYAATITISAPAAVNKTTTVAVTLTVNAATPTITGTWPAGVIQGSGPTVVTVSGSSYYASSTVAVTGFTPEATVTVDDGMTTASIPLLIPVYQSTATGLRLAVASPLPNGSVGTAYSQPLSAAGGTGPYTYSFAGGILPPGLSISGTNLAGTPSAAGTYLPVVQVTDSSTPPINAYAQLQLTVDPSGSTALQITVAAAPLPLGTAGTAYGPVTLAVTGGSGGPYTWSAANLPPGMALSSAGVLSGTPSTDGAIGAVTGSVVSDSAMLVTLPAADLANAGVLRLAVTTQPPGGGTSNEGQFEIYGPGPQIMAVTNSADFAQGIIAPGDLITIFGLGLGPADLTIFDPSMPPIPTALPAASPSTSVTINGTAAPILYTSATQIGLIVPYTVSGASAQVAVSYNGVTSAPFSVSVAPVDPGVFSLASSGQGQGAILNVSATGDYTINSSSNPAPRGSTAVIYITGAGATTSSVYNQLIPASPAVTPLMTPTVTIGGQPAILLGAQAPPGSVPGLIQLNVTVPSNIQPGVAQPVVVTIGGVDSQAGLTMAVR
jgi:uncharacterized protein (TIGR03437 family)